jgi:hypothetical protein
MDAGGRTTLEAKVEKSPNAAGNHSCHFDHREKSPDAANCAREISPYSRYDITVPGRSLLTVEMTNQGGHDYKKERP